MRKLAYLLLGQKTQQCKNCIIK